MLTGEDPQRIAGYWLAARLGAGGQGTVYDGYDEAGQRVAVKVLRPELVARPDIAGRFAEEVLAAQRSPPSACCVPRTPKWLPC